MEAFTSLFAILVGLLLRLAIPLAGTLLVVYFLRTLDARWTVEAQQEQLPMSKVECWKVKGCSPAQKEHCTAACSSLPCWQVLRQPNGYLQEKCISCNVFIDAPIPALKH